MRDVTVIIPSLDPDEKLVMVVDSLIKAGYEDILLIDDGSDADHQWPFEKALEYTQCEVLHHGVNKGKGRALKTAFDHILKTRTDILGVITVDGDNQHTIEAINECVQCMRENPRNVVLGARKFNYDHVPFRSRFGNNMTRNVFRIVCGIKITDTQTGLRAIPNEYLAPFLEIKGERFEYETNMLLAMKNMGIEFLEVIIPTVYIEENASSHFRVVRDSVKIYSLILKHFFRYMFGSLSAALLELIIFTILNLLVFSKPEFVGAIVWANIIARAISSFYNFVFNRRAVFKSTDSVASTAVKYYTLCVCQAAVSTLLIYFFTHIIGAEGLWQTLIKFIVDCCLFVFSFQIQRGWVFKNKKAQ